MKQITINIRRHSLPNKNDAKKDYSLSPEGWELAVEEGKKLVVPEGGIKVYSSPKNRAQETGRGILFGAYQANKDRPIDWNGPIETLGSLDSMLSYCKQDVQKSCQTCLYDEAADLILREDTNAVQKAGEELKGFIDYAIEQAFKSSPELPVLIEGVTHGPKIECLIAKFYKSVGQELKEVQQIGRGLKELEGVKIKIKADAPQEYELEWSICRNDMNKV